MPRKGRNKKKVVERNDDKPKLKKSRARQLAECREARGQKKKRLVALAGNIPANRVPSNG